jgi:uncharacterized protein RhaS with RHS repeats
MGARVYDPYTGTFTQPDPIQGSGANAYGYTDGDPVNETDLSGDCTFCLSTLEDAGRVVLGGAEDVGGAALSVGARVFGGTVGGFVTFLAFPSSVGAAPCEMHNDCGMVQASKSPALPSSPYSPESVAERQKATRQGLGLNPNPALPIPDQPGPGRGGDAGSAHPTGERNVGSEEHSRTPKGSPYYGR